MSVPCTHVDKLYTFMKGLRLQLDQSTLDDWGANIVCHECKRTTPINDDYWPPLAAAANPTAVQRSRR